LAFKVTEIVSVFILIQTNVTNVVIVVAAFSARLLNILSFDLTPWQYLAPSFQNPANENPFSSLANGLWVLWIPGTLRSALDLHIWPYFDGLIKVQLV